jgi:hypothetical protein
LIEGGVDSVELKVVVPMSSHRATIKGLGLDPIEAEPRQVFFFDTPDMELNQAGVVVRARRIHGGTGDTVVKLRPVVPATIDAELRRSKNFKTEVDVLPGGFVCSGSFKGRCTAQEVLDAVGHERRLRSLFSKEQRAFYDEHAPAGIDIDSLVTFGPTFILKTRLDPKKLKRRLVVELWLYPDGSRNVEISTQSLPGEAFQVAAELKAYLKACGVEITAGQPTKTKAAMEFFKAEMPSSKAMRRS